MGKRSGRQWLDWTSESPEALTRVCPRSPLCHERGRALSGTGCPRTMDPSAERVTPTSNSLSLTFWKMFVPTVMSVRVTLTSISSPRTTAHTEVSSGPRTDLIDVSRIILPLGGNDRFRGLQHLENRMQLRSIAEYLKYGGPAVHRKNADKVPSSRIFNNKVMTLKNYRYGRAIERALADLRRSRLPLRPPAFVPMFIFLSYTPPASL